MCSITNSRGYVMNLLLGPFSPNVTCFWSDFIVFNDSSFVSDIARLTLMRSVNDFQFFIRVNL